MPHQNRFVLRNDWSRTLILNIEPEGAFFPLKIGEEVSVTDVFRKNPVTLKLSHSEAGDPIISLWPGDGEVRVEQGGADVLNLLSPGLMAEPRDVG